MQSAIVPFNHPSKVERLRQQVMRVAAHHVSIIRMSIEAKLAVSKALSESLELEAGPCVTTACWPKARPKEVQFSRSSRYRLLDAIVEGREGFRDARLEFRLRQGEMVVFNQRRMLHGRNGFVSRERGDRTLAGTYLNIDEAACKYRVLARALGDRSERALWMGNSAC